MKIKSKFRATLVVAAAVTFSVIGGAQGASAASTGAAPASTNIVKSCGFDFWGQSYQNCGSSRMAINAQYIGGEPWLGWQYMGKEFCVKPHSKVSVLIPGGFWLAETVIDNGPAHGPGKC